MGDNFMFISDDEVELLQQDGPLTAWACPDCTVENQPTYLVCECCGRERPSDPITNNLIANQQLLTQGQHLPISLLDSQSTQPNAAPLRENGTGTWTCIACTFINSTLSLDCDVCGAPSAVVASPAAAVAAESDQQQQQQEQQEIAGDFHPPPSLDIPLDYEFNHRPEDASQKFYTLDCCCCGPLFEIKEAARVAVVKLPSAPTLLCMLRHFSCPASMHSTTSCCTKQMSRRDLQALLGAKTASAIDRGVYCAAITPQAMHLDNDPSTLNINTREAEGISSAPYIKLRELCIQLATAIQALHCHLTASTVVAAAAADTPPPFNDDGSGRVGSAKKTRNHHPQQKSREKTKTTGIGYGGREGDDTRQHRLLKEQAAARQRTTDSKTARTLRNIRAVVQQLLHAEETFHFVDISPIGWLPLGAVGLLQGSPLAACLRLLLCNDSLMDVVTDRKEVYSEAMKLVTMLASRQELIPMLLVPADGDILAQFSLHSSNNNNTSRSRGESEEGYHQRSFKKAKIVSSKGTRTEKVAQEEVEEEISIEAGLERSCWKALQSFSQQCNIFMKTAQQLADDGTEEDVSTVGTVLLVQETCSTVDQAVNVWKKAHISSSIEPIAPGGGEDAPGAGPSGSGRARGGAFAPNATATGAAAAVPTSAAAQHEQYAKLMKELAFRSINLVEAGDYYYRNQLSTPGQVQGDGNARLRRVMRDISSLSTDLPTDWNSSILIVQDETRLDAFRAVIFPPEESPYSNGAFFFDILLPADYPNSPPKVQFLTTGGGRIRFNPNLYDTGKVCLSLLGTWSGPSWDPKESSLLQVVVSIQAMILGEKHPYGNEPGFEKYLNRPEGKVASEAYNRTQRYNTAKYSILPAVQAVVAAQPKSSNKYDGSNRGKLGAGALGVPKGFEETLKLHYKYKYKEIQHQLNQWRKENAEFNAGDGGGKNKQKQGSRSSGPSLMMGRMPGMSAIADAAMDETVNSIIDLLDQIQM